MLTTPLAALRTLCLVAAAAAQASPAAGQATGLTAEALIGDSVSSPDDRRYNDVTEAIRRFQNNDQLSARTFLERAVQKNPKLPPVGVLIAKMQLLSGNGQAVRSALEQAVQDDSANDPEPFLLLAEQALGGGRTIEADALFDKAVALIEAFDANAKRKRQFQIRAYRGRAVVADRRGNWDQMESDLRSWLEQDPDSAEAHAQLGQVLFRLERPRDGYEAFVEAKRLNQDLPNPFVSAALMYSRIGQQREAMAAFEKALKQDADDATAQIAYAQALVKAGELDKSAQVLGDARRSGEQAATVLLLSGVVERMRGDTTAAGKWLSAAMVQAPSNRDVLNQLSLVMLDTGEAEDRARALQFAQMNQRLNQSNADVNITLAWVLFQNSRGREATQALRQGLQAGALSPDGSFLLAKMLLERDDRDNARRLLESALGNDAGIFVNRAEAEKLLASL
ncbi:MAG: tetratricopeptide repeat protein [Planctomycetota bacterium]